MKLKMINYNFDKYLNYLDSFETNCNSNHYNGSKSTEFFRGLLRLSDYKCFYCGESLVTNSISGLYYEREHIINKKYYDRNKKETKEDNNISLTKCKYNLIPICKTCNSLKKHIITSSNLVEKLNNLELAKSCNASNREKCERILDCFDGFKDENFNPFSGKVEFDILHKIYINDYSYISQFRLNQRTQSLFINTFNNLYKVKANCSGGGFLNNLKNFSTNSLENQLIDYLDYVKIIDDEGTIESEKLNNLIETITLLEEFE